MSLIERVRSLGNNYPEVSASALITEIEKVRAHSSLIAFTGKPYKDAWRGMFNGANALFPDCVIAVPHRGSENLYSEKDLKTISEAINDLKFEKVFFSGYANCLKELLLAIHHHSDTPLKNHIYLSHHGALSSHGEIPAHAQHLQEIIELHQKGVIRKIGFFKKGLAETLNKILGIKSQFLINIGSEYSATELHPLTGLNMGVFTHHSFRKNLHNQVAAALMLENATVHVHDDHDFEYLQSGLRLKAHPFTESYDDFLNVVGSMTLNFYVTFSECYGLLIAESLSMGVPCLASNSGGFFDYDEYLAKALIVDDYDNSESIYKQAQKVLANRDEIAVRGKEYVKKLNAIAKEKLNDFLNE